MRKLIAIALIGSVAVGLLAGCGSGDAQQIDREAFVREANEICKRVSGTIAAQFTAITQRESSKPGYDFDATQVVVAKRALIPGLEEQIREIRALGIPEEAKKETEALHAAYQRAIANTKADPKAILASTTPPYEPVELAGTRFGVTECPIAPVMNAN